MTWKTEEDASKTWCPFSRGVVGTRDPDGNPTIGMPNVAFNRIIISAQVPPQLPAQCMCIGQHCAAWVWEKRYAGGYGRCGLVRQP